MSNAEKIKVGEVLLYDGRVLGIVTKVCPDGTHNATFLYDIVEGDFKTNSIDSESSYRKATESEKAIYFSELEKIYSFRYTREDEEEEYED